MRLDIEREGASVAYQALLQVCRDPKAPAQAKAAAGVAILRGAGLYDTKRRPRPDDDPAGMTADELRQAEPVLRAELERMRSEIAARAALLEQTGEDDDEGDDEADDDVVDVFA